MPTGDRPGWSGGPEGSGNGEAAPGQVDHEGIGAAGQPPIGIVGGSGGGPGEPGDGTAPPPACVGDPLQRGVGLLRHLTREQYANSVRDLVGVQVDDTDDSSEQRVRTYPANAGGSITSLRATEFQLSAEDIAAQVQLEPLLDCDIASITPACLTAFIESFGRRAYRRPIRSSDVQRFEQVYSETDGGQAGVRQIIAAMLQSPYFLNIIELGEGATAEGLVRLTQFELATRLSLFLWNSIPDDELLGTRQFGAAFESRSSPGASTAECSRIHVVNEESLASLSIGLGLTECVRRHFATTTTPSSTMP